VGKRNKKSKGVVYLSKILALISFGVTLIGFGAFWSVFDGVREYFDSFLIPGDPYYTLMYFGFRAMPVIVILIGIMCLIAAGIAASSSSSGEAYQ